MGSATEYLMALATSQKRNLQNKDEMKNGDIQHLIIERNNKTRGKKKINKKVIKLKKKKIIKTIEPNLRIPLSRYRFLTVGRL